MKHKKWTITLIIITLFAIFIAITFNSYYNYSNLTNSFIASTVENIAKNYPDVDMTSIIEIINNSENVDNSELLTSYGFSESDLSILASFEKEFHKQLLFNSILFLTITIIILLGIYLSSKKRKKELKNIIKYLKELNRGNYDLKIDLNDEGEISILKNEIYTTTIMLREQAEKELVDKINLKDSLTNISHQLKTPLTSISLLVDNLIEEPTDAKTQKEFLLDIKTQVESINYLIIALLKLSRFDANVITFKKENINVKSLLLDILKHIDILREVKNVDIHITGNNETSFVGDYKWEFEALTNILKNCLEYTPAGKNIYINYKETNVYTEILIADEGKGMNEYDKKHIFERFYKGEESNNLNFGIGLSLAKEIITKDNGKITVESKINTGSTFKIRYYK